jgi:hypothetical protein
MTLKQLQRRAAALNLFVRRGTASDTHAYIIGRADSPFPQWDHVAGANTLRGVEQSLDEREEFARRHPSVRGD